MSLGFGPPDVEPYALTPDRIELFLECPRCFYLDQRLGVPRPAPALVPPAFAGMLNQELDVHRAHGTAHPLTRQYGIDAVPLAHELVQPWRTTGIEQLHHGTGMSLQAVVDDVWVESATFEFIVVVFTNVMLGTGEEPPDWTLRYKRRMEWIQWLLRRDKQQVSPIGYLIFCDAGKDEIAFDGLLDVHITILPYYGDVTWVPRTLEQIALCLTSTALPEGRPGCEWCAYRDTARRFESGV